MKKTIYLFCIYICLSSCSDNTQVGDYPVIDIVNKAGKYKKVYCSDFFSSIELIPLETNGDCLVIEKNDNFGSSILLNDNFIFMKGQKNIYVFNHSGKFLNPIGSVGQGPHEYVSLGEFFLNTDSQTIFVPDFQKILEYDYTGKFIRSLPTPIVEGEEMTRYSYIGDNLFVGQISHSSGKNKYKYCIFDRNGDIVKCFPNYTFFDRVGTFSYSSDDAALPPIPVDDRIYLKDFVNDTIYILSNLTLQPAYVFGLGRYAYPKESMEDVSNRSFLKSFRLRSIFGTPNYFFYQIRVPDLFSRPKSKSVFDPVLNRFYSNEGIVYGIYNIAENTNILLDTDDNLETGTINDINGGLPFFPRFYAGNDIVIDYWAAEKMKELLTDEYFATQTIKDQQSHQKLTEILKNLREDDNPIVVVAKLK